MRFFFYGTLMAGSDNRLARLVETALCPLGPSTTTGALHAIPDLRGWYPALLRGDGVVFGHLYEGVLTGGDLARLDCYEDYDPARPEASLYVRREVVVTLGGDEAGLAEAYVFNRPLPDGALPIPGGDYRGWLAEHDRKPFGG